jgi:N6-L-threonylcarbamoyladenine synthase
MQLGTTLDDSVGECFDKVARMLGLDVLPSGGPSLEAFAKHGDAHAVPLTMPLYNKKTCEFSYSGLKTSVNLAIEERAPGVANETNRQVSKLSLCADMPFLAQE